jgi:hypothetical protein
LQTIQMCIGWLGRKGFGPIIVLEEHQEWI